MSLRNFSVIRLVALVAIVSHLLITLVDAHGYVTAPASRAYFCKTGQAKDCGEIQYEPQSVEAPKGLPFARSGGANLCSAGLSQFAQLDRQGAKVWPTTKAADVHSFSWTFTAQHATTNFRYFITRPDWDASSTRGLTANDLESDPFLTVAMNGKAPPATMKHDLSKSMPTRTGHHIVYAVWTVDNTANAFYQCIDLDFGGSNSNSNFPDVASPSTTKPAAAAAASSSSASSSSTSSASDSNSAAHPTPPRLHPAHPLPSLPRPPTRTTAATRPSPSRAASRNAANPTRPRSLHAPTCVARRCACSKSDPPDPIPPPPPSTHAQQVLCFSPRFWRARLVFRGARNHRTSNLWLFLSCHIGCYWHARGSCIESVWDWRTRRALALCWLVRWAGGGGC